MHRLRSFLVALVMMALCAPLFAQSRDAQRRHPRPGQHREYREPQRQRQYRPYRPHYRYSRPYQHYRSPRHSFTCRVWFRGYWAYDSYGEYWEPGHWGYVLCR